MTSFRALQSTLRLCAPLFLAAVTGTSLGAQSSLYISEFMATNEVTKLDEDGDATDWIEIRNPHSTPRSLTGWYLTDDANELEKWQFPTVELAPGENLLVFASAKDRDDPSGELHTNFRLNKNGEYLALVQPNGLTISSEYAPTYPEQHEDISYGLNSSGAERFFQDPTPGWTNTGNGFLGVISKIWFSHERGVYSASTSLQVTPTPSNATVRYTLDGSVPTESHGSLYSGPITLNETTVLRVFAHKSGYIPSEVQTHTYISLLSTSAQPASVSGYAKNYYDIGSGNAQVQHDYEMDPQIVASDASDLLGGLTNIPSMSVVVPPSKIFGNGGFYDGTDVEIGASIEVIYPNDPVRNHQANAGIEAHSHKRLKRSLRLNFRNEFGDAKFHTDLFTGAPINGESATDTVDRIILRGGNNRSWARNWNPDKTTYAIDQFYRDSQIAMSGVGAHGNFVHLYINGLYWGLYNATERPDQWFTSTYLGGNKDDWFAMNHGGDLSGNDNRFDYLTHTLVNKDLSSSSKYAEFSNYLDIDPFIDYLTLAWWLGLGDWPSNNFYGGNRNNSSPLGATPHRYFAWDGEWCLDAPFGFSNSGQGAKVHPDFKAGASSGEVIPRLWHAARKNEEFMIRFADRVHANVHNGGPLSDSAALDRWATLNDYISDAIVAESARWGDSLKTAGFPTRTRDGDWLPQVSKIAGILSDNAETLISVLRAENYYPDTDAPVFAQHGGNVQENFKLAVSSPDGGTIYFTLDGSDPRSVGGGISSSAQSYSGPITLTVSGPVRARVRKSGKWSALTEANFFSGYDLRISEFMADNASTIADEAGSYEDWVEIHNTGEYAIQLGGLFLTDNFAQPTQWAFPEGAVILPDEHLLVWADSDVDEGEMHANFRLAAGGEQIGLFHADGNQTTLVHGFAFGQQATDISTGAFSKLPAQQLSFFQPSPGAQNEPQDAGVIHYDAANPNKNGLALTALTPPKLGQLFIFEVGGAPAFAPGVVMLGQYPVSVPISGIDSILVLPDSAELWPFYQTNALGRALTGIEVPYLAALVGHTVYFQAGAEPLALSNGVAATFGL